MTQNEVRLTPVEKTAEIVSRVTGVTKHVDSLMFGAAAGALVARSGGTTLVTISFGLGAAVANELMMTIPGKSEALGRLRPHLDILRELTKGIVISLGVPAFISGADLGQGEVIAATSFAVSMGSRVLERTADQVGWAALKAARGRIDTQGNR